MLRDTINTFLYRAYKKVGSYLFKEKQKQPDVVFKEFIDSFNYKHKLLKGHRDKIQPGWRNALSQPNYSTMPSDDEVNRQINKAKTIVGNVERQLSGFDFFLPGKEILEFGCHNGAKLLEFLSLGASSATGSDIPYYYKLDRDIDGNELIEKEQVKYLNYLRKRTCDSSGVIFENDNITDSKFSDNSFDLVFSWNVLEHVQMPDKALVEINRILKPGGISFSKYNPFFCQGGGHSLCTLDFPWGHVRLAQDDYYRYLSENRKSELNIAKDFYNNSLNRMTIEDFKAYALQSGMEVLAILPWTNNDQMFELTSNIIRESKRNYSTVDELDLISPGVITILRKN